MVVINLTEPLQASRQPGSAFKPFIYAAALDQGYSPNSIFFDEPTTIQIAGSKTYQPRNYTGEYQDQLHSIRHLAIP